MPKLAKNKRRARVRIKLDFVLECDHDILGHDGDPEVVLACARAAESLILSSAMKKKRGRVRYEIKPGARYSIMVTP